MIARDIQIVGIGCRVPRASSAAELIAALGSAHPFPPLPADRARADLLAIETGRVLDEVRGALLERVDLDLGPLKLPPRQAEAMHAMERAALASIVDALADAGIEGRGAHARTQVFLAASSLGVDPRTDLTFRIRASDLAAPLQTALVDRFPERTDEVLALLARVIEDGAPQANEDTVMTTASLIAARIANVFDFVDGHVAIDAGATSSLIAVERAARAVASGDCDVAVVCAVSELVCNATLAAYAEVGALGSAPPRPFEPDSPGTLLGEGAVAIVLAPPPWGRGRPYARLLAARHAASASNGMLADTRATRRAMEAALAAAGMAADDVAMVVSRAAGFGPDDEAERAAAIAVYGDGKPIVSVTPSLGFLQGAAGLAALAGAAASLRDGGSLIPEGKADAIAVTDAGLAPVTAHAILAPALDRRPRRREPVAYRSDEIAIVGVGALVPGAANADAFWDLMQRRVVTTGNMPRRRIDVDRLAADARALGLELRTAVAGIVDRRVYDATALGLASGEADELDGSELMTLAVTREALQRAGYFAAPEPSRTGVIIGQLPIRRREFEANVRFAFADRLSRLREVLLSRSVAPSEVEELVTEARRRFDADHPRRGVHRLFSRTGLGAATVASRWFGIDGGAFGVDAACASGLAALRFAAEALRDRELDLVVAGGVADNLIPEYYFSLLMLGALSPDGSPPFVSGSRGFVPAEGAAAVALRRLDEARSRGDHIYAVIRGIGYASDGHGRAIMAPNPLGLRRAIGDALAEARLRSDDIEYIEGHGGGTDLGDTAELTAYCDVYGHADPGRQIVLATVKAQIGHLSAAAGAVSLVSAAMALDRRQLPATELRGLAPDLPVGERHLDMASDPRPWTAEGDRPRRAAVTAFGIGGVNFHAILEEDVTRANGGGAPQHPARLPSRGSVADRFVPELVPLALPPGPARLPVAGRSVLVLGAEHPAAHVLAQRLRENGASVHVVAMPTGSADVVAPAVRAAFERVGTAHIVIDLRTLPAASLSIDPSAFDVAMVASNQVTLAAMQSVCETFADSSPRSCAYIAVTGLGGDLGLTGAAHVNPLGAALQGWVKGLKQEMPHVVAKCVDFDPDEAPEVIADVVLDELLAADDRLEVGWIGRRLVVNLRRASFHAEEPVLRPPVAGEVYLFTGGGRGVVFECAAALARRGVTVIVTGRTPRPPADAPWLHLDDETFEQFKRDETRRLHARDRTMTPARIQAELRGIAASRELDGNLRRVTNQRLPLRYEVCDVGDREAVGRLVDRIVAEFGRLDGVVHGAMVEHGVGLARKTSGIVDATFRTKVTGLLNVMEACADAGVRTLCSFGSGAGRFGNSGQTDYSGANALLAFLTSRARELWGIEHAVTINWTAWAEVGAAIETLTAELLKARNITFITVVEGTYWFLGELALGRDREVVICGEEMLYEWPFLGSQPERALPGAVAFDDRGRLLVPGEYPLIDVVTRWTPDAVEAERLLDVRADAFLAQHLLNEVPIVPATMGCEMLAEAAALSSPGFVVVEAADVAVDVPLKVHQERLTVRLVSRVLEADADRRIVEVESSSDLRLRGQVIQSDRRHYRGRFTLSRQPAPAWNEPVRELPGLLRYRSMFEAFRDPVELGPLYCRAEQIQVGEHEVVGVIRPPRPREVMASTSYPRFQLDPLIMDTAFQIAANWDARNHGFVSIPFAIGRVAVGRRRGTAERARIRARPVRREDDDVFYDIDVVGEDDAGLLRIERLQLRRIATLPPADP